MEQKLSKRKSENKKQSKIKASISYIIIALLMALCFSITISVVINIQKDNVPRIFGYSLHVVITDSMTPVINVDDVVIAKKVDNKTINVGDDIVFRSEDPNTLGMLIVHRVIEINKEGKFVTQGVKVGASADKYPVSMPVGSVVMVNSFMGKALKIVIEYKVYFFAVFLIGVIVLALSTIKSIYLGEKPKDKEEKAKQKAINEIKEELKKELEEE